MRRPPGIPLLALALALGRSLPAGASPIEVLGQSYDVHVQAAALLGAEDVVERFDDAADAGPVSTGGSVLAQTPHLAHARALGLLQGSAGADRIAGRGVAETEIMNVEGAFTHGEASSVMIVAFTVHEDLPFVVRYSLSSDSANDPSLGGTPLFALRSLSPAVDPLDLHASEATPGVLEHRGRLRAGVEYELEAGARTMRDGLGSFESYESATFWFELSAVPEPGTAAAVALGIAVLGARKPRR